MRYIDRTLVISNSTFIKNLHQSSSSKSTFNIANELVQMYLTLFYHFWMTCFTRRSRMSAYYTCAAIITKEKVVNCIFRSVRICIWRSIWLFWNKAISEDKIKPQDAKPSLLFDSSSSKVRNWMNLEKSGKMLHKWRCLTSIVNILLRTGRKLSDPKEIVIHTRKNIFISPFLHRIHSIEERNWINDVRNEIR